MPKLKLGTGNKRAVLSRPKTSYSSPRVIKQRQRQAQALDLRLQGQAYHRIAKELCCHPSTAHDYVVKALANMMPVDKREAVLQQDLMRLDQLQSAVYANAAKGDPSSIEITLKIMGARAKLLGLNADGGKGGQHLQLNVGASAPAREPLEIRFVRSTWEERPDGSVWKEGKMVQPPTKQIEARPPSGSVSFGPDILKFDKC